MAVKTATSQASKPKSTAQVLKDARRAYERALREAGITVDDLELLKELAAERLRASEKPAEHLTRVYL